MSRKIWVFKCLILAVFMTLPSSAPSEPSKANQRIDELFVWMVSEKLQLKAATETEFSHTFKELSQRKQDLTDKADKQLEGVLVLNKPEQRKKAIDEYRMTLLELGQIQAQEVERLSKILGDEKFVQYLAAKQELGKKIRTLVSPKN